MRRRRFHHTRNARRTKINDLHRAGAVDHDVFRAQILMQHFHAVKSLQAFGNLLDDAAHGFKLRLGVVDHPLRQRLAFDKFADDVQVVALARLQAGL